jgi:hypothetical protein
MKRLSVALAAVILLALSACAAEVPQGFAPQILRPPTNVTAVPGDGEVTVSWTAPSITENIRITSYTVISSTGETYESEGVGLSFTVTGLENGTAYSFTVTANNSNGPSEESEPSEEVIPSADLAE